LWFCTEDQSVDYLFIINIFYIFVKFKFVISRFISFSFRSMILAMILRSAFMTRMKIFNEIVEFIVFDEMIMIIIVELLI